MADRWFRVPNAQVTTDGYTVDGPKHRTKSGVSHAGNRVANSPQWIVRFYGNSSTLDEIAADSDVSELTASEAANALNNGGDHLPDDFDATNVNERFSVG